MLLFCRASSAFFGFCASLLAILSTIVIISFSGKGGLQCLSFHAKSMVKTSPAGSPRANKLPARRVSSWFRWPSGISHFQSSGVSFPPVICCCRSSSSQPGASAISTSSGRDETSHVYCLPLICRDGAATI